MTPERWVQVFVIAPTAAAIVLMFWLNDYRPSTWFPSLACYLFTTGLAILGINIVVARAEQRRKKASEDLNQPSFPATSQPPIIKPRSPVSRGHDLPALAIVFATDQLIEKQRLSGHGSCSQRVAETCNGPMKG